MQALTEEQATYLCEAFGCYVVKICNTPGTVYEVWDSEDEDSLIDDLEYSDFISLSILVPLLHSVVFNKGINRGKAHMRRDINELLNPSI